MSKRFYKDEIGCIVKENILDGKDETVDLTAKCIIEEYIINGTRYQIMYKEETKANEVFSALNRMIVSGKDRDIQDDIQILKLFNPCIMEIPIKKSKWWKH